MKLLKTIAALAISTSAAIAIADTYDADYLTGSWSLEGARQCGNKDNEQVVFSAEGGISVYNDGRLESMGFWAVNDKVIRLHIVSSVARLDPERTEFEGEYNYVIIDALTIRQKRDEFEVVARVDGDLEHIVLSRCR